jgi:nucleoside-diphosphate-sugar epimerase
MKVLILGANGFIGSHLSEAILAKTDWKITAIDLTTDKLTSCLNNPRFDFMQGDITVEKAWVKKQIEQTAVVLPLVAIATPALYVQNPLRIFELDFEANLEIIRHCATVKKRLIFPSTSEVYGMCPDQAFDEEKSNLVTGPIQKERWIYSSSKQLLDRLIYAYGKHHHLPYSLFRPFNWYGPRLDNVFNPKPGGSRVLTQFIGNILRGEDIQLVNGGTQRRCFTYIDDGIDALLKIIENPHQAADNRIFNIGNPYEDVSIHDLATLFIETVKTFPAYAEKAAKTKLVTVDGDQYFGPGYQDVSLRVPAISRAEKSLAWKPQVDLKTGLQKTLAFYLS